MIGGFDPNADPSKMSAQDQAQWYATNNKLQAAKDAAAAPAGAAPAAPATAKPSPAEIRAGNLTDAQIATLSYQEQQTYKQSQARVQAKNPLGAGSYVAPAPAKASDYVSDQHFVAQITDPVTGESHAATSADVVGPVDWKVTDEQTVQGQMKQLTTNLSTNPVYQSIAETMKRANAASGGGNSLMAESAAYDKVIGLAFNIASSDAATYAKSAEFNATMTNQFGLAKNNFVYQALLSDQNYAQSQVLQSNQIKGNLDSVDRQVSGQLESTRIAGQAQMAAAATQAGATVASAYISADAAMKDAALSAKTSLQLGDIQRQTALDTLNIDFQTKAAITAQQGAIDIAKIGATGAMNKDVNAASAADTLAKSITLGYQNAFNTQTIQTGAEAVQISTTPGLSAEDQARGIKTILDIDKGNKDAFAAFASGLSHNNPAAPNAPNYADYVTMPGFAGVSGLDFYKGHVAGTNYPTAATADTGQPFVPTMPVPG